MYKYQKKYRGDVKCSETFINGYVLINIHLTAFFSFDVYITSLHSLPCVRKMIILYTQRQDI